MDKMLKVFNSEIRGIDEKEMTITAYISTDTRDRMNESLDPAGLDQSNFKKNPVVLWAHDYTQPPIGKALWVKKDGVGVISKVKFASTEFAKEIFNLYKEGFLKAFSVGFMPKKWEDGDGEKQPRRKYTEWELLEYSAVPVPANPDAVMMAMQKGILKTDSIIKSMENGDDEENDEEDTEEQEDKPLEKNTGLEDLMAENVLLKSEIESLNKENQDLRYRLFDVLKKYKLKLSEIAVSELDETITKVVHGAIRKHMGKVE